MEQSHDGVSQLPAKVLLGVWLGSRQADSHGFLSPPTVTWHAAISLQLRNPKGRDLTSVTGR